MGGRRRRTVVVALAAAATLAAAPAARATFHEISIREVYAGAAANPDSGYVELQMYAPGQNLVGGHGLTVYDAGGTAIGSFVFPAKVANAANQQTILIGDSGVQGAFGVAPDLTDAAFEIRRAGGAACWAGTIDCVSWGNFTGSTPSPAGTPADPGGIPDATALRRTIEPGCPTLLDPGDDRNDSAADFLDAAPAPRPNSVAPSEQACSSPAGGGPAAGPGGARSGDGGGKAAAERPQTSIRSGPPRRSRRRRASFRFVSDQPGSTFLCSLDGSRFVGCHSPYTARNLKPGRHLFRVKARQPGGPVDNSPAAWAFRVLAAR